MDATQFIYWSGIHPTTLEDGEFCPTFQLKQVAQEVAGVEALNYVSIWTELNSMKKKPESKKLNKVEMKRLKKEGDIDKILNCGKGSQYSDKVRFKYRCSKQWQEFQATKNETIRFCDACQENVYYCNDKKEADSHARQGHCIAISIKLSSDVYSQFTPNMMGRPDTDGLWASDIFDV